MSDKFDAADVEWQPTTFVQHLGIITPYGFITNEEDFVQLAIIDNEADYSIFGPLGNGDVLQMKTYYSGDVLVEAYGRVVKANKS